jgi:hypothetical protein
MLAQEILYTDISRKDGQLFTTSFFVRDKKYGGGSLLKVKIHILFYGDIS